MNRLLDAAAGAPKVSAAALLDGRASLVVVAPHPDDETLGCGELIFEARSLGTAISVVCMTDGSASHPNSRRWPPAVVADLRRRELAAALAGLAPDAGLDWLGYADCGLPAQGAAAAACRRRLNAALPEAALVACAWGGDPHVDHERTAGHVAQVLRDRPDLAVIWYPIWGRFAPTHDFAGLSRLAAGPAARAAKRRALSCHASQMTGLISDDPQGFVMSAEHQAHFLEHPEIFLAA